MKPLDLLYHRFVLVRNRYLSSIGHGIDFINRVDSHAVYGTAHRLFDKFSDTNGQFTLDKASPSSELSQPDIDAFFTLFIAAGLYVKTLEGGTDCALLWKLALNRPSI